MKKVLYHGSSNKFNQFDLAKALENKPHYSLAEGNGIYLTDNKEIAMGYGKYLYEVHYSYTHYKEDFLLAWDMEELQSLIKNFSSKAFDDSYFFADCIGQSQIDDICQGIIEGDLSITGLNDELYNWLDCSGFYFEEDDARDEYDNTWFDILPAVIEYYDKSFDSLICICHKQVDRLEIKNVTNTVAITEV